MGFVLLFAVPLNARQIVSNDDLFIDAVILTVSEKRDGATQQASFRAKVLHTYSPKNRHKVGDEVNVVGVLNTYVYLNDLQPGATCHARMRPVEKSKKKTPADEPELWDIGEFRGIKRPAGSEGGIGEVKQMDLDSMSDEMKEYLIQMGAQNVPPPEKKNPKKK
jgi:hypothetical protein